MAAGLIELTQAHNISLESRDEVDAGQLVMIASLADEQDGAVPFDLNDGAVAEFHHPANPRVKLGECRLGPGHMVCCPRVEDPSPVLLLLTSFTDLSENSLLLKLNWLPTRFLCYAQLELFLGFDAHRSSYAVVDYLLGSSSSGSMLTGAVMPSSITTWAFSAVSLFLSLLQQFLLR